MEGQKVQTTHHLQGVQSTRSTLAMRGSADQTVFTTRLGTAASTGRFTDSHQGPTISMYIKQSLNYLILGFFSLTSVCLFIADVEG